MDRSRINSSGGRWLLAPNGEWKICGCCTDCSVYLKLESCYPVYPIEQPYPQYCEKIDLGVYYVCADDVCAELADTYYNHFLAGGAFYLFGSLGSSYGMCYTVSDIIDVASLPANALVVSSAYVDCRSACGEGDCNAPDQPQICNCLCWGSGYYTEGGALSYCCYGRRPPADGFNNYDFTYNRYIKQWITAHGSGAAGCLADDCDPGVDDCLILHYYERSGTRLYRDEEKGECTVCKERIAAQPVYHTDGCCNGDNDGSFAETSSGYYCLTPPGPEPTTSVVIVDSRIYEDGFVTGSYQTRDSSSNCTNKETIIRSWDYLRSGDCQIEYYTEEKITIAWTYPTLDEATQELCEECIRLQMLGG